MNKLVILLPIMILFYYTENGFSQEKLFELNSINVTEEKINANEAFLIGFFKKKYKREYDKQRDLQKLNTLKTELEKDLLRHKIGKMILEKNGKKYFAAICQFDRYKNQKEERDKLESKEKQNLLSQIKAYEYLRENQVSIETIKKSYNLFLKKEGNIDSARWEKLAKDKSHEKQVITRLEQLEQSSAIWEKIDCLQFIGEYALQQLAETDPIVKKYLETKNNTNKRDDQFEFKMYHVWLLNELKKEKSFILYTNKYGNIEEIMNYETSSGFFHKKYEKN